MYFPGKIGHFLENGGISVNRYIWKSIIARKPITRWYIYPTVTSARSCNNVGHLFWFTILAQHETNDVILYIHSVHKHRGNTFQRQNYKTRLKQRSLNWINSMQVKKILLTNVFFFLIIMLVKYVSIDGTVLFPSPWIIKKHSINLKVTYLHLTWI
jgi:hypothetical protein